MQNLSYGKEFDSQENEPEGETHFNINGSHKDLYCHRGKSQLGNGKFIQTSVGKPLYIKFLSLESLNKIQLQSFYVEV